MHISILPFIKFSLSTQIQGVIKVDITLEFWSVPNGAPYLGPTAHWLQWLDNHHNNR
jgi:hypothetical protein